MIKRLIDRLLGGKESPDHLRSGEWGEKLAAKMLKKKGCKILGRRVRFGKRYEIDIVVRDGDTLVFVEVKTRASEDFGRPIESVDRKKKANLSKAALIYMRKMKSLPEYIRFDVVEVVGRRDCGDPAINHIENAFHLDPRYRLPFGHD